MLARLAVLLIVITVLSIIGQQLADHHSRDNNESFRKLFHVIHGIALAGLAFVVPLSWLIFLEIFFLISVFVARVLLVQRYNPFLKWVGYFGRAYRVGRLSYGEFFYPVSAIILVLLAQSKWEFATAILILGLSDTAAALIGKRYGKKSSYSVFGQKKSLIGSVAFFMTTLGLVTGFALLAKPDVVVGIAAILGISLLLTVTENVGVYGSDNLLIPIVAVVLLNRL